MGFEEEERGREREVLGAHALVEMLGEEDEVMREREIEKEDCLSPSEKFHGMTDREVDCDSRPHAPVCVCTFAFTEHGPTLTQS